MTEDQIQEVERAIKTRTPGIVRDPLAKGLEFVAESKRYKAVEYYGWERYGYVAEVFEFENHGCLWHDFVKKGSGSPRRYAYPACDTLPLQGEFKALDNAYDVAVNWLWKEFGLHAFVDDLFIAGGAPFSLLRGLIPNDYDIYFRNPELARQVAWTAFQHIGSTARPAAFALTPYAITTRPGGLEVPLQLVFRHPGEPSSVVSAFDFIHTQIYWTPAGGLSTLSNFHEKYFKHVLADPKKLQLVVNRTLEPSRSRYSLWRCKKFLERGFTIGVGDWSRLITLFSFHNRTMHEAEYQKLMALGPYGDKGHERLLTFDEYLLTLEENGDTEGGY